MESGALVPDSLVLSIIKEAMLPPSGSGDVESADDLKGNREHKVSADNQARGGDGGSLHSRNGSGSGSRSGSSSTDSLFLFDGYPRTQAQAAMLDKLVSRGGVDAVVSLDIPHEVIVKRMENRYYYYAIVCVLCVGLM